MPLHHSFNSSDSAIKPRTTRWLLASAAGLAAMTLGVVTTTPASAATTLNFNLLTWNDAQATTELPSAVGVKPANGSNNSDWLVFAGTDSSGQANPQGSLSHNFADLLGAGSPVPFDQTGFAQAPSLSGSLTLELNSSASGSNNYNVSVTSLAYDGVATSLMTMNQYLVKSGDAVASNPIYNFSDIDNSGTWDATAAANWAIQYNLNFYFDASVTPAPVELAFNNKLQQGYLIPISELQNLSGLTFAQDGYYSGDFATYLTGQIVPRLPDDATYLLVTQMDKVSPSYAVPPGSGFPGSAGSLIGNMTFAYSTNVVPEPATASVLLLAGASLMMRRGRRTRQA